MDAPQYTGSLEELPDILESWSARELLVAWRDAAVARRLAEAGAVHPAVHTPTRVMQWLERDEEWERNGVSDAAACWERVHGKGAGRLVYVPMNADTADYRVRVLEVLRDVAFCADVPLSQVLTEVAAMPEEWAW